MGIIETIKMLEREEGIEEGIEIGADRKSYDVVRTLFLTQRFTTSEIANFANVSEAFVEKVIKDLT